MPSTSLARWRTTRSPALDEIEAAHAKVGGSARGRRYATEQINYAYAVLLSSQFQGYCRDLHTEAVDRFVRSLTPAATQAAVRRAMTEARKLDKGNPNAGNIGSDFAKLGLMLFQQPRLQGPQAKGRKDALENLNLWRNAIAHQDFSEVPGQTIHLGTVKGWRAKLGALAVTFDAIVGDYIGAVVGTRPW